MNTKPYSLKDSGYVFLFATLILFLSSIVVSFSVKNLVSQEALSSVYASILNSAISEIGLLFVYIIYNDKRDRHAFYHFNNQKVDIKKAVIGILCGGILLFGCLNFTNLINSIFAKFFVEGSKPTIATFEQLLLSIIFMAGLPAISEELIFRGVIFEGLKSKYSWVASAFISALCFALVHFSIFSFVYQFILGFVLAVIAHYSASIITGMVAHFTNNAVILIFEYLNIADSVSFANFGALEITLSLLILIVAVVAIYFIVKLCKRKNVDVNQEKTDVQIKQSADIFIVAMFMTVSLWLICAFGG